MKFKRLTSGLMILAVTINPIFGSTNIFGEETTQEIVEISDRVEDETPYAEMGLSEMIEDESEVLV